MQYRKFGKLDWEVSALGFGCMRFPSIGGNSSRIDEKKAAEMLYYAIDHGVNYLDTAYPYHGGKSEGFVGKTLEGSYREKVKLATKLPCWKVDKKEDFDSYLNEQLKRLRTEQIDFYLLHSLNEKNWEKMESLGVIPWIEKALSDGRISQVGFSFHDEYPVFKNIVDSYEGWDICLIQYNYMDVDYQAGKKGLSYAADNGLGVVIMEPIRGGRLVDPPGPIQEIWNQSNIQRTAADLALQWLWNQPEVSVVISGMSTMQHVKENVSSADHSGINSLSQEELKLIANVKAAYEDLALIPCTRCGYCIPCPEGVDIVRILELHNDSVMYEKFDISKTTYNLFVPAESKGDVCVVCGECEEKCPQDIPISDWMAKIHQIFTD
jgi:predicted aldo/keto reductase-like oxidoreductase